MPHPFSPLSTQETEIARNVILEAHPDRTLNFREIFLKEPQKALMKSYLAQEHGLATSTDAQTPPRLAFCQYDVIGADKFPEFHESIVDLDLRKQIQHEAVPGKYHASLTLSEFDILVEKCEKSPIFKKAISEIIIPEGFDVVVEPWPYGAPDTIENKRVLIGLCFAVDRRSKNPDANFYSYPLPLVPIMDWETQQVIKVDRLATGGKGDGLYEQSASQDVIGHCKASEYIPELRPSLRKDLKELSVIQPDGPSFTVTDESLIEWQKWRFRVGFNPREGATIHDVHYDGRSVLYRLSVSEMVRGV